jgi:hypothetical protein
MPIGEIVGVVGGGRAAANYAALDIILCMTLSRKGQHFINLYASAYGQGKKAHPRSPAWDDT